VSKHKDHSNNEEVREERNGIVDRQGEVITTITGRVGKLASSNKK
jgi:hypothetical protein